MFGLQLILIYFESLLDLVQFPKQLLEHVLGALLAGLVVANLDFGDAIRKRSLDIRNIFSDDVVIHTQILVEVVQDRVTKVFQIAFAVCLVVRDL